MESKKIKIQIKSFLFGRILFEYEAEGNTIKETLRNAVLSGADLRNADLSGAVLSGAVLSGADLSGADLSGAVLPIYCKWSISIVDDKVKIGCKIKTIEEWDSWFEGTETFDTPRDSEAFKRIQANYIAIREYYKFLNL